MGVPRARTIVTRQKYASRRSDPDALPALPDELVVCILEFLSLRDLRAAAAVGRQFYFAAWRAGLYIERTCEPGYYKKFDAEVTTCRELVQHALRKDLRLALTVDIPYQDRGVNASSLTEILRVISNALPVLVFLSLTFRMGTPAEIFAALSRPAPRLRSLFLCPPKTRITHLPGIFSGNAPQLRELGLAGGFRDADAIPAFANVVRFQACTRDAVATLKKHVHLPKLAHLYVLSASEEPDPLPPGVDLASMALRPLVVRDIGGHADSAPRSLRDPNVPAAHYCADEPWLFDWRGWNSERGGSLSAHITGGAEPLSVRVAPADGSWRRSYSFSSDEYSDAEAPIVNMPGLPARLEYLRMRAATVLGFLLCEAEFPALRGVRVDVACAAPADPCATRTAELFENSRARCELDDELAQARFRVRCPALAVVAFHRTRGNCGRGALAVRQTDVAFLCRALTDAKPALELCGLDVAPREPSYWRPRDDDDWCPRDDDDDGDSLDDFFSSVSRNATPGGDGFDDDVWADVDEVLKHRYLRQSLAS